MYSQIFQPPKMTAEKLHGLVEELQQFASILISLENRKDNYSRTP